MFDLDTLGVRVGCNEITDFLDAGKQVKLGDFEVELFCLDLREVENIVCLLVMALMLSTQISGQMMRSSISCSIIDG